MASPLNREIWGRPEDRIGSVERRVPLTGTCVRLRAIAGYFQGKTGCDVKAQCIGVCRKTEGVRDLQRRTKPLRGGKDRDLVHKPSVSATRPIDPDFAPCLYQRASPCYSPAWIRSAAGSAPFFTSCSSSTLPKTRPLPIYSIYIKAKAVPVAASSSELASARPTGPELRPHSPTALRIQLSSDDAGIAILARITNTSPKGVSSASVCEQAIATVV